MSFAQISVNHRCNLRCRMCDIGQREDNASGLVHNLAAAEGDLSPDEWLAILDRLSLERVHIVGVEPLLYAGLGDLLSGLRERDIALYVTTNGYLLDPSRAELLARHCDTVAVSIDGPDAQTHDHIRGVSGSFDRAFEGLMMLKKLGVPQLSVSTAITPDNSTRLVDIYELFTETHDIPVVFNHYNYVAPESCDGECAPQNAGYDPKDIDVSAVSRAIKRAERAKFLPALRGRREVRRYYRAAPTRRRPVRCRVIDAVLTGQRFTISPDGRFLISSRCWHEEEIGDATKGELPSESEALLRIAEDIDERGLPPQCQRLCCAGKVL